MQSSLQALVNAKTVPNTLLLCGAQAEEMKQEALDLAHAQMGPQHRLKIEKGIHPDVHIYTPQGKLGMHPMEGMLSLINEVSLPPFEAPISLFIILDAHRMLPTSSNALLKTLEEPAAHAYIVLITSSPESLLPTIVSRCRRIDFGTETKRPELNPHLLSLLSEDHSYVDKLALYEKLEAEVDQEEEGHRKALLHEALFEQILTWYRDLHLLKQGGDPAFLVFGEHRESLQKMPPPPAWDPLQKRVETCRLALQRSMKLRTVLDYFFL